MRPAIAHNTQVSQARHCKWPQTENRVRNCPRCVSLDLREEQTEDITIDRCPQCRGIWLDPLELERLLASHPRQLLAEDRHFRPDKNPGTRLTCPECKGAQLIKMSSLARPGTILDSCTVCYGAWLDAGELAQIADGKFSGWLRGLFAQR